MKNRTASNLAGEKGIKISDEELSEVNIVKPYLRKIIGFIA